VLTIWYKACVKTVEDDVTVTEFDAIAYPNPYDQYFMLQLSTESDENVSITVYDMAGKLLENLTVQPSDVESLQIGRELSTGVYNVMVTQGREAKVLRLMKR
jgi:phosphoribosylformylglycinamidine (FGAM) synthase PurS component